MVQGEGVLGFVQRDCLHNILRGTAEAPRANCENFASTYIVENYARQRGGRFATIKICVNRSSSERVAVKVFRKLDQNRYERERMQREIRIIAALKSRKERTNVVNFVDEFSVGIHQYLVMENMAGKHLLDDISTREFYSEKDAASYMVDILAALAYCHGKGITHRDVRPENLMLNTTEREARVKLIDFGLAEDDVSRTELGGAVSWIDYSAPEMLRNEPYGMKVDVWASGVVLYNLLTGASPFTASAEKNLFKTIETAKYDEDTLDLNGISLPARDMISALLKANPSKRINSSDAASFPFLQGWGGSARHLANTVEQMKSFTSDRWERVEIKRKQESSGMPLPSLPFPISETFSLSFEECIYEDVMRGIAQCRVQSNKIARSVPIAVVSPDNRRKNGILEAHIQDPNSQSSCSNGNLPEDAKTGSAFQTKIVDSHVASASALSHAHWPGTPVRDRDTKPAGDQDDILPPAKKSRRVSPEKVSDWTPMDDGSLISNEEEK